MTLRDAATLCQLSKSTYSPRAPLVRECARAIVAIAKPTSEKNQNVFHTITSTMYLLIHTMTVTQTDCVMEAQFFHTFKPGAFNFNELQLVARRVRVKLHPNTSVNRNKLCLQQSCGANLKTITKRKYSHVKHHLRTIQIVSPSRPNEFKIDECVTPTNPAVAAALPRCASDPNLLTSDEQGIEVNKQSVTAESTVQQIAHWLSCNRFTAHLQTFAGFSGADMLRMSKEDLMQICGQADGIRLFNALHSKSIAPKLTLYVCRENSSVFHAVYLSAHNSAELLLRVAALLGIQTDQVRAVYCQGPHGIHVHVTDEVLRHVKEESMFAVDLIPDNNAYVIVLKPIVKS